MKNLLKYLILILAFLSIGKASAYSFSSAELREEFPLSSEDLKAANISLFALRENPFQEIFDLTNKKSGIEIFVVSTVFISEAAATGNLSPFYQRDIRRDIARQLFPKHFFL